MEDAPQSKSGRLQMVLTAAHKRVLVVGLGIAHRDTWIEVLGIMLRILLERGTRLQGRKWIR